MHYIPEMALADYMCLPKKKDEDLSALKTTLMNRCNDSKST